MDNLLTRKLELFGPLSDEDKRLLDDVVQRPRSVNARTTLISEGDAPSSVHLIMSGLACRLKRTVLCSTCGAEISSISGRA